MGIKKLWPELRGAVRNIDLTELKDLRAGVDVSIWLHKSFDIPDRVPHFVYRHISILLDYGIKPILVFDGKELEAKDGIIKERQRCRQKKRMAERAEKLTAEGKFAEAEKYKRRSRDRIHKAQDEIKVWCGKRKVKFVQSPYEADAQLAYMDAHNEIDFVISSDSYFVVYGVKKILLKYADESGELFEQEGLKNTWADPFNLECIRPVCILVGSDY